MAVFILFYQSRIRGPLKVKISATVVKIKKKLEKFEVLEQLKIGVNQPNRLYLLQQTFMRLTMRKRDSILTATRKFKN